MAKIKLTKQQIEDGDYESILTEIDTAAENAPITITLEIEITDEQETE